MKFCVGSNLEVISIIFLTAKTQGKVFFIIEFELVARSN